MNAKLAGQKLAFAHASDIEKRAFLKVAGIGATIGKLMAIGGLAGGALGATVGAAKGIKQNRNPGMEAMHGAAQGAVGGAIGVPLGHLAAGGLLSLAKHAGLADMAWQGVNALSKINLPAVGQAAMGAARSPLGKSMMTGAALGGGLNALTAQPGDRMGAAVRGVGMGALGGAVTHGVTQGAQKVMQMPQVSQALEGPGMMKGLVRRWGAPAAGMAAGMAVPSGA